MKNHLWVSLITGKKGKRSKITIIKDYYKMTVNIIVAVGYYIHGKGYPIGKNGKLPWHNSSDLKWFKETTMGHPVIMGRKTWESLPKALPGRINIVVGNSSIDVSPDDENNVYKVHSVEEAISKAKELSTEDAFIIGGASIYNYALEHDLVDNVYVNYLTEECNDADTFFTYFNYPNEDWAASNPIIIEAGKSCARIHTRLRGKNNHVDEQYLQLINDIITNGEEKDTRAGKTRSVFGRQLRFNLKEGLPILTTKKVFTKGVIHELLWFLNGNTNIKYLVDNNVHIWDDDAYRYYIELCEEHYGPLGEGEAYPSKEEFLEHVKNEDAFTCPNGFHYKFGDLNRVYGAQWTDWGGHNQVQEVIDKLKTNPDDRRMIISAWNVDEIPYMALPPCHFCCQFYTNKMTHEERIKWLIDHAEEKNLQFIMVDNIEELTGEDLDAIEVPSRKLSCMFHMRSNDICAGTPFNWASYAILTHMIAQCVNMEADELIYEVGDAHVYKNQIEIYEKEQKKRNPHKYALPKLVLNPNINNIFDFKYEDIKIEGYQSYPSIKYPLSVGL